MAITNIIRGIGHGSMFEYGRVFGVHVPFGALSKAKDPFINLNTLNRLSRSNNEQVRSAVVENLAIRLCSEDHLKMSNEQINYVFEKFDHSTLAQTIAHDKFDLDVFDPDYIKGFALPFINRQDYGPSYPDLKLRSKLFEKVSKIVTVDEIKSLAEGYNPIVLFMLATSKVNIKETIRSKILMKHSSLQLARELSEKTEKSRLKDSLEPITQFDISTLSDYPTGEYKSVENWGYSDKTANEAAKMLEKEMIARQTENDDVLEFLYIINRDLWLAISSAIRR